MDAVKTKAELRAMVVPRVKDLLPAHRLELSRRVCARLMQQRVWSDAGTILFFAALPDEVEITPLIERALQSNKRVGLPQFDAAIQAYRVCEASEELQSLPVGRFGIREPRTQASVLPLNEVDLILTPGVAFDLNGRRLGRGRGYYDRLLAGARGVKCGVAFDEQLVDEIPVEGHDVLLDCMVTPSRWLELRSRTFGNNVAG